MIKKFQFGRNLPTAPDAKEAYKGGTYKPGKKSDKIIGPVEKHYVPRQITRTISPNSDTTYVERPKYHVPEGEAVRVKSRKANSLDKDRTEYEILNRRFNEAASVSKKQQGGQMQQDQEELKLALTGYIIYTKKLPKSEEEVLQLIQEIVMLKQKDPKTYTQLVQLGSLAQQQQQATMAKWGSKLQYIRSLKYAKGGKTCPTCQQDGKPLQTNSVEKPIKKSKEKIEEKACGGKAKKHYFGGIF